MHTFWYIDMSHVTVSYDFIAFFWVYSYIIKVYSWWCSKCCNSTKFLLMVWLFNTHIKIYWRIGCDCKLWNASWFYCFWEFCTQCMKCWISTKHSQIVCLLNTHILIYFTNMPDVTTNYENFSSLTVFFFVLNFNVWYAITSSNFHKFWGKIMKIISIVLPYFIACNGCL